MASFEKKNIFKLRYPLFNGKYGENVICMYEHKN